LCESERVFLNANEHERASIDIEPRDTRLARELIARYPLHRYERLAPLMRKLSAII
jgi:Xaa-Pro aminopeptidase